MPNIWIFRIVRLLAALISHLYFRVEYKGVENIPTSGPFLMTPNHVSYFDPIWISVPVRRPIRYMTWD
ncbi:MAG: lysophospholipid acyltransferase family protein, partial [Acidobacteriota bacterium]